LLSFVIRKEAISFVCVCCFIQDDLSILEIYTLPFKSLGCKIFWKEKHYYFYSAKTRVS